MLEPGTILIKKDTPHPQCFHVDGGSYPDAWQAVSHNFTHHDLERELSTTGWTFFYLANSIRTTAFGFNRAKMIQGALKRVIANVRQQRCNCLEIDGVAAHSFMGIPYVSVSAHPRHIQMGLVFAGQ